MEKLDLLEKRIEDQDHQIGCLTISAIILATTIFITFFFI